MEKLGERMKILPEPFELISFNDFGIVAGAVATTSRIGAYWPVHDLSDWFLVELRRLLVLDSHKLIHKGEMK